MGPKQVTKKYHYNRLHDLNQAIIQRQRHLRGQFISTAERMGLLFPNFWLWNRVEQFIFIFDPFCVALSVHLWSRRLLPPLVDNLTCFLLENPYYFLCSIMSVENLDNKSSEMTNSSHRVSRTGGQHLPKWLCHRCRRCHRHRHSGTTSSSWSLLSSLSLSQ